MCKAISGSSLEQLGGDLMGQVGEDDHFGLSSLRLGDSVHPPRAQLDVLERCWLEKVWFGQDKL
jgi:hypothetical protein